MTLKDLTQEQVEAFILATFEGLSATTNPELYNGMTLEEVQPILNKRNRLTVANIAERFDLQIAEVEGIYKRLAFGLNILILKWHRWPTMEEMREVAPAVAKAWVAQSR